MFPADAPARECLVRVGETVPSGAFGTYRFWITRATHDAWANREKMSNEDVDATFVYGSQRVVYNIGARYSGSSYTAPIYDTPTGNLCGYDLHFPADDRLLGDTHLTLDWPIRDDTDQREQLMFWFLDQYGLPNMYRRYVHLFVNGRKRGTIYDDTQQPGAATVSEWWPDDDEGALLKTDCWNEFDDGGNRIDPCVVNTLQKFTTSGGVKKVSRYRWNWRPRASRGTANDFSDLFALVDAVNSSTDYLANVERRVDVEHWMRTFAMNDLASFWDAFGNPNAKNTYLYKPDHDGWKLLCWDFDVGLGVFNDPPNAPLFEVSDPTLTRLYRTPAFVRLYWAALQEALSGFFQARFIDPILDAKYAALRANGISLAGPSAIKSWISQRRTYLQSQLNTVRATFAVTSNSGNDFSTNRDVITLTGTAPVSVRTIKVNGISRPVIWTTVTNWSLVVGLSPGLNGLSVEGVDRQGSLVSGASDAIRVEYTGTASVPPAIRLNEWMAANRSAVSDPADGAFDDWFELYNAGDTAVSLAGFTLTDTLTEAAKFVIPTGTFIPSRGFLLVWADEQPEQTQSSGELHVNFKLNQDGDTLALFDPGGRLIDSLTFGPQAPDASEGRWPDGAAEPAFFLTRPTPRAPNALPAVSPPEFRLSRIRFLAPERLILIWAAHAGRTYRVRYKDDLSAPVWVDLPGDITATADAAGKLDTTLGGRAQRFYQVVLLP